MTEQSGIENLHNEGVTVDKVNFVGNVMTDTLIANHEKAQKSNVLNRSKRASRKFAVITLHKPSNVDDMKTLGKIIDAFEVIQNDLKLIFPIHPLFYTQNYKSELRIWKI